MSTTHDAGVGRSVPITRRRALALLAAVPAAVAIGAALPTTPARAVEPTPEWPPAIWDFTLLWHEPLTADELAVLRKRIDGLKEGMVRRGWADRWIQADEWGHVTLTWEYAEGEELLEILGIIWQVSMSNRRVAFNVSYTPIPGPRTEAQWTIARERHRQAVANA